MTTQAKKIQPDNLMGATEVAEYLGVSRQRVLELRQKKEGFPKPLSELRSGPVWDRVAIDEFVDGWDRKPGRPRKEESHDATVSATEEQFDPATSPGNEPEEVAEPNPEPEPGLEPTNEPSEGQGIPEPPAAPEQPSQAEPAPVDNPQVPQQPSADQIDLFEGHYEEPLHSVNG